MIIILSLSLWTAVSPYSA